MVLPSCLDFTFHLLDCLLSLIAPRISTETKINIDMHLFYIFISNILFVVLHFLPFLVFIKIVGSFLC